MERYKEPVQMENTCVAYGCFDSIHKGHLAIAKKLVEIAKEKKINSVIVSIPKDGDVFTTEEEKEYLLKDTGVEALVTCNDLVENVLEETVIKQLGAKGVVTGEHSSELSNIKSIAKKYNIEVVIVDSEKYEDKVISMNMIQEAFDDCDYVKMSQLLGHPYIMLGEVVHGKALGRTVGMPTANLQVSDQKVKPLSGVYCTRVVLENEMFKAMTNIGKRPSVDTYDYKTIEAFILDFARDIYGKKLVLEVHKFVRGVIKFNNLDEVQAQVQKDIQEVRDFL